MNAAQMKNTTKAIVTLADAFCNLRQDDPLNREYFIKGMEALVRMAIVDSAITAELHDFARCMGKNVAELG